MAGVSRTTLARTTAKIAWRNVWRNGRRSWVLIGAVAVGVFSFVGSTAFMDGFGKHLILGATDLQGGHIQVAADGYHENPLLDTLLPQDVEVSVAGFAAPQIVASGMANSSDRSAGVVIRGVDPGLEPNVTVIADRIVEGTYLEPGASDGRVVVGAELAERLRLRLGEKLVLMVNNRSNEVSAGAYRIQGLFKSGSTDFDRSQVYLDIEEARSLFGAVGETNLIAIRLTDAESDVLVKDRLTGQMPAGVEVLTWKDRNPFIEMATEAYDYSVILMAVILFAAVGFTLINSFLMVIFERIREIGVLLAGGVKPAVIRRMLMTEALFVALIGMVLGIVISAVLLGYWFANGLDLSDFAEGLGEFGIQTVVYPVIDPVHMAVGFLIIFLMVLLSVFYPAFRASRFDPVEAITHA